MEKGCKSLAIYTLYFSAEREGYERIPPMLLYDRFYLI